MYDNHISYVLAFYKKIMNDEFMEEMDNESLEEMEYEYVKDNMEFDLLVVAGVEKVVSYHTNYLLKEPCRNSPQTRWKFMMEILKWNGTRCHEMFCMEKHVFYKLCDKLRSYGLKALRDIRVEEAVGMFLNTLGHDVGNRFIQERF
ncbi:hypothetical protein L1049_018762 [Liquidambar formosana]|uniref:DUF8040 domain-containing protein n=1 Tax=Liquidambar formosana TaxID=63359 RepID=A0AAP0RB65_LIQFO